MGNNGGGEREKKSNVGDEGKASKIC